MQTAMAHSAQMRAAQWSSRYGVVYTSVKRVRRGSQRSAVFGAAKVNAGSEHRAGYAAPRRAGGILWLGCRRL